MSSVWRDVEPLLSRVERPARYIDSEWGAVRKHDVTYRAALLYPDAYEIGMANQALAILYQRINAMPDIAAERCYLPWIDMIDAMRESSVPLFTLESATPLVECDLIGITLPYELTYTNILEALDLAGIPLTAAERDGTHPLVIAGGPCAVNPEPVAPFFDAIFLGEAEDAIEEIVSAHKSARDRGADRAEILDVLAAIGGVYVPSVHGSDAPTGVKVTKRVVADLGAYDSPTCPVVPFMDVVHDRVAIEILRGCTRGCRFCQAGMIYRPVRERSSDEIVREAIEALRCTGYDEVSLTSLSSADHSQIADVLRRLSRRLEGTGVSVSLPSLRVDAFSIELARLVSGSGRKSGLTFAPEAGTQRMRDVINKNVTEEDLLSTVRAAFGAGWRRLKLYFMIGLPTETDEDVAGIGELTARVLLAARDATPADQRGSVRVAVSVSTFVPKAHTPFQWYGQISPEEIKRRQTVLRGSMPRKGVDLSWHDANVSFLEGALARGGRELSGVIEAAWRRGARFDAWTERFSLSRWLDAFADAGVDPETVAGREFERDEPLPWAHISVGVAESYLWREYERALAGKTTEDCAVDSCTGCGVCGSEGLGVEVVLGGVRDGAR